MVTNWYIERQPIQPIVSQFPHKCTLFNLTTTQTNLGYFQLFLQWQFGVWSFTISKPTFSLTLPCFYSDLFEILKKTHLKIVLVVLSYDILKLLPTSSMGNQYGNNLTYFHWWLLFTRRLSLRFRRNQNLIRTVYVWKGFNRFQLQPKTNRIEWS